MNRIHATEVENIVLLAGPNSEDSADCENVKKRHGCLPRISWIKNDILNMPAASMPLGRARYSSASHGGSIPSADSSDSSP